MYATSKLAADFLTANFHDAYGLPAVVTRMFNTYGPRQNPRYITGTIITQALERDVVEIGNLEPERDFVYCGDSVRAHLLVGLHGRPGDVYCFGQGEHIAIGDWAELILRIGEEEGFWPKRELVSRPRALPAWRKRRHGAAMRLDAPDRAHRLAAAALVGGGRTTHDQLVRARTAPAG